MDSAEVVAKETAGVSLGDSRLERRFARIVGDLVKRPESSFPLAAGDHAALEATYRFLNNAAVTLEGLIKPHVAQTALRARTCALTYVVHDTTEFVFTGDKIRAGLGRLQAGVQGFRGHFALAVDAAGNRPLGVVGLETIFRPKRKVAKKQPSRPLQSKESFRWHQLVDASAKQVPKSAIHIMDAEADSAPLLGKLIEGNHRFVVRAGYERLMDTGETLSQIARRMVTKIAIRDVSIGPRGKGRAQSHRRRKLPPRAARTATVHVAARPVVFAGPTKKAKVTAPLAVNLVHVFEPRPPKGEKSISWRLYTTEPIDSEDAVLRIVDIYRARWIIEEYFKSLKTGCAFEKRQLETRQAILNSLALMIPIAWSLLLLRSDARSERPSSPLTTRQIRVLRAISRKPLGRRPSASKTLLAVARLGGHIPNNGDPGWIVLGRGYQKLLAAELGWVAALQNL